MAEVTRLENKRQNPPQLPPNMGWVPMDGYYSPKLHRIQEAMALVFQRLVEALCRDHTQ